MNSENFTSYLKSKLNGFFAFFETDKGKKVSKWIQRLFSLAIVSILVYQIVDIGIQEVLTNIPTNPVFHFIVFLTVVQLPLFEVWIYHIIWKSPWRQTLPVMLVKNVYNRDVMGYSGEVYLFVWAQKFLNKTKTDILKDIKDINVVSSFASTFFAIALLSFFFFTGLLIIDEWINATNSVYFIVGSIVAAILIVLIYFFRKVILTIPYSQAFGIFSIHFFRLVFYVIMMLIMFLLVIPEISLKLAFTFIAAEIIITRIPFIPNRDLVFTSLSLEYIMATNPALGLEISALLVARNILVKLINFATYGVAHVLMKRFELNIDEIDIEKKH